MIRLRHKTSAQQSEQGDAVAGTLLGFDDFDLRLGDVMRGERATLGKSLLDVQRELRIRASHVAAIENCDTSAFDTPSFIAGYVRSYARYLGMDPDWTFRRFCAESGFQPTHGMAPAASGPKPSRRPSDPVEALANPKALFIPQPEPFLSSVEPRAIGSVLVLALLVGGLGYGGWSVLQEVQKVNLTPSEQAPGVITALDPVRDAAQESGDDKLALNLPQPEGLDRTFRPQALDVPVLVARDGPIAAIDPGLPAQIPVSVADAGAGQGAEAALDVAMVGPVSPGDPTQAVRTVAPDAPEVELLAVRPAWVRVTSSDGTVLLEKTLDAGERFALPKLEEPPMLRAGNSGAVYFAVNGETYGPAAPGAQVVKNVKLAAEDLKGSFQVADLSKDADLAQMIAVASAAPLPLEGDVPAE